MLGVRGDQGGPEANRGIQAWLLRETPPKYESGSPMIWGCMGEMNLIAHAISRPFWMLIYTLESLTRVLQGAGSTLVLTLRIWFFSMTMAQKVSQKSMARF